MRRPFLIVAVGLLLPLSAARGHDARPLYLEIAETAPGVFSAEWQIPSTVPLDGLPALVRPEHAIAESRVWSLNQPGGYQRGQTFRCPGGWAGAEVGFRFAGRPPNLFTLVNVTLLSGEHYTQLLDPGVTTWQIPERATRGGVAWQYTRLGVLHIWAGVDHLLFLACLVMIAGTGRRILITITGFTIAHSITLALSALDIVRLPIPPVEATIALSIVFVAFEIARHLDSGKTEQTLTYRYPAAVSSIFGLLHGFGFAAVLREIGLPQTELLTSLLFFNVGVEIGQVLFVVGVIALGLAVNRLAPRPGQKHVLEWIERPAVYAIGCLASFWLVQRVAGFWN